MFLYIVLACYFYSFFSFLLLYSSFSHSCTQVSLEQSCSLLVLPMFLFSSCGGSLLASLCFIKTWNLRRWFYALWHGNTITTHRTVFCTATTFLSSVCRINRGINKPHFKQFISADFIWLGCYSFQGLVLYRKIALLHTIMLCNICTAMFSMHFSISSSMFINC